MRAFGCDVEWKAVHADLYAQADVLLALEGPVWFGGQPITSRVDGHIVLVSSRAQKRIVTGETSRYKRICMDRVATFLAFLDAAPVRRKLPPRFDGDQSSGVDRATPADGACLAHGTGTNNASRDIVLTIPRKAISSDEAFRTWLLGNLCSHDEATQALIRHVRSREAYSLIGFLLQDRMQGQDRLLDICKAYGLSTSYFRKLCKKMLGHNAKSALSHWRAVNALLDIVTKSQSILHVALGNGYCSASHISRDIHQKFGHAPSAFRGRL